MRDTVRVIAHDILLIGGAICMVLLLVMLCIRLIISVKITRTVHNLQRTMKNITKKLMDPIIIAMSVITNMLEKKRQ